MNRRRILNVLLAAILVGTLAFLIFKIQSINLNDHNSAVNTLRQLKQTDAEWNVNLLKTKIGLENNYDAIAKPLPLLESLKSNLTSTLLLQKSNSAFDLQLQQSIVNYEKLMDEKINLIDQFKSKNAILRNSLRFLPTATSETIDALNKGVESFKLRLDLQRSINSILIDVMTYSSGSDPQLKSRIDDSVNFLRQKTGQLSPEFSERLEVLSVHLNIILTQQVVGDVLMKEINALSIASAIDNISDDYQIRYNDNLIEQNIYQKMLIGYSIGLLMLLAYFGWNLFKSYQRLNIVNRELDSDLKEATIQLAQAEKMSALGQMVAGIAHEINTPLAYLKGSLEMANEQLPFIDELTESTFQYIQLVQNPNHEKNIADQALLKISELSKEMNDFDILGEMKKVMKDGLYGIDKISEIVQNLKNFSRLDRSHISHFSVEDGLNSTLILANHMLRNKVDIIKEYSGVPLVKCSPSQINQVFLNIITNAVQAMPSDRTEKGIITLRTAIEDQKTIRVEISDNGDGIPKDVLPKIFDPFFTTKEIGKGTGMGLSISYKIIQQHGGQLKVHTEQGVGTVFIVLLPLTQQEVSAKATIIDN